MKNCTLPAFLFLSLLLMATGISGAQDGRLLRIEFEVRANTKPFSLLPLKEEGLLLIYPTDRSGKEGRTWVMQHYSTSLQAEWKREEIIPEGFDLLKWEYIGGKANLLFSGEATRDDDMSGRILSISPAQGSVLHYDFSIPEKGEVYQFDVEGAWFVIASRNRKYETTVLLLDAQGDIQKVKTGLEEEFFLDDAQWHPVENELYLLFKHRFSRKEQGLVLLGVGPEGVVNKRLSLYEDKSRWPSSGQLMLNDSARLVLFGTYSRDERTSSFQNQSPRYETASGFVSLVLSDSSSPADLEYFPFTEFNDYFNYLSYQDVSRLRSGKSSDAVNSIDFRIILHDLRVINSQVVMLGEAYYEKYQYVTRMAYDFYGRPVPTSYSVFEGYEYTNAFIAGFDQGGGKLWDNNFEFRDFRKMNRTRRLGVLPDGEEIVIAYMDNGNIASKAIRGTEVVGAFDYYALEGAAPQDRVEKGESERIIHWYDRYALCFGYQKIRSVTTPSGDKRNVFYISKVTYR